MWLEREYLQNLLSSELKKGFPIQLVCGPPGVGKSTLLRIFQERFSTWCELRGLLKNLSQDNLKDLNSGIYFLENSESLPGLSPEMMQDFHLRSIQVIAEVREVPKFDSDQFPWVKILSVPGLYFHEVMEFCSRFQDEIQSEIPLNFQDSLVLTHPGVLQEWVRFLRKRSKFTKPDFSEFSKKSESISMLKEYLNLAPERELLRFFSTWHLPLLYGDLALVFKQVFENLESELDSLEEAVDELLMKSYLERDQRGAIRLPDYLRALDCLKSFEIPSKVLSHFLESENPSLFQEALIHSFRQNQVPGKKIQKLLIENLPIQNPSRMLQALNLAQETDPIRLLKARCIVECSDLKLALKVIQRMEGKDPELFFFTEMVKAKTLYRLGELDECQKILSKEYGDLNPIQRVTFLMVQSNCQASLGNPDSQSILEDAHETAHRVELKDPLALIHVNLNVGSSKLDTREKFRRVILEEGGSFLTPNQSKQSYRKLEILLEEKNYSEAFLLIQRLHIHASARQDLQKLAHAYLYEGMHDALKLEFESATRNFRISRLFFHQYGDRYRETLSLEFELTCSLLLPGDYPDFFESILDLEISKQKNIQGIRSVLNSQTMEQDPPLADGWHSDILRFLRKEIDQIPGVVAGKGLLKAVINSVFKGFEKLAVFHFYQNGKSRRAFRTLPERIIPPKKGIYLNICDQEYYLNGKKLSKIGSKKNLLSLLLLLGNFRGEYLPTQDIYEILKGETYDHEVDEPVVRVSVNRLKKELGEAGESIIIRNLLSSSYQFSADFEFWCFLGEKDLESYSGLFPQGL